MSVEYISYIQTENLLKTWPTIQGIKESLERELSLYEYTEKMGSGNGYIYTKVIGNKVLSGMPHSGNLSDTTGDMALNVEKMWDNDMKSIEKQLLKEMINIGLIDDKLNIAFRRLLPMQQQILKAFYLDNKTWAEVLDELKKDKHFLSKQQAQAQRKDSIEKVQSISKITVDMYEFVMKLVEVG